MDSESKVRFQVINSQSKLKIQFVSYRGKIYWFFEQLVKLVLDLSANCKLWMGEVV